MQIKIKCSVRRAILDRKISFHEMANEAADGMQEQYIEKWKRKTGTHPKVQLSIAYSIWTIKNIEMCVKKIAAVFWE